MWPKTLTKLALCVAIACAAGPGFAQSQGNGSGNGSGNGNGRPLHIDIDTAIDFGIAAQQGNVASGAIELDPTTGVRRVTGGLVAVGGNYFSGQARLTGQPFARVRIVLPTSVKMNARQGSKAVVASFTADVPSVVTLDANGTLLFNFAGRVSVNPGEEGEFKGRFAITADYE